ncbi:cytochrome c-550 PedF [Gemmobacter fulvus]|uniref:cytochrome c-550 PedF n=1 Tax=Gemmobacter fulvus TaxID=2840474 RepID=UPI002796B4B5|nr:cytochrome c-550 PedF [Gemmobacter fulvus]MDQ1850398.1 cytochrome c-550 PedF [Gemmobacter fulvus]
MIRLSITCATLLICSAQLAFAHGDTVPQAVDTSGLPDLGEAMASENPWRTAEGDLLFSAVEIGAKGFNSNCARCHGLEAIAGGLAPDLRYLEASEWGDEWYLSRVLTGYEQNGAVKMPPFADILSPEAIWAIRTYIETRPDQEEMTARQPELSAAHAKVEALAAGGDATAIAAELDALGDSFAALSGAARSVTALHQAAHILRADPARAPAAAELIAATLRN